MRVAIIGGGRSGAAVLQALTARGVPASLQSRSTGLDVLGDDVARRLAEYDVIVEATGLFTTGRRAATEFFTRSTRAIAQAANASGARHVLLSIVRSGRPEVQGYGYYAGKTAQEAVARATSHDLTVVRSTQWFEFPQQLLERLRVGPVAPVPRMTIQPVSLAAVAGVIADVATGSRRASSIDVAGPEVMSLQAMARAVAPAGVLLVPVPLPGRYGRAFRTGALVPGAEAEVVGGRFADWLAAQS